MIQLKIRNSIGLHEDVGKVSTIFEVFASGFVLQLELHAELNSASNGATFDQGRPDKTSLIPRILFF
jgi:hypothetical protein